MKRSHKLTASSKFENIWALVLYIDQSLSICLSKLYCKHSAALTSFSVDESTILKDMKGEDKTRDTIYKVSTNECIFVSKI